mmetsp:Transcript_14973/g.44083  ORF Transcript_14973/g.44083 Transcript_14973/m.44083 type:complete len:126 (+) Transcript_14973:3422-3799(+)
MPTLVPVPVRARVRRYDSSSGTFELVPVHSMPDNILINAAAAVPPAPPHTRGGVAAQSRLWVGFNVEDAATHVKLVSKETKTANSHDNRRGEFSRAKKGATAYDAAVWAPQSSSAALPSLIMKDG